MYICIRYQNVLYSRVGLLGLLELHQSVSLQQLCLHNDLASLAHQTVFNVTEKSKHFQHYLVRCKASKTINLLV